jgi:hypothetical protein
MPRSKASENGDEHLQELHLLKQDVQDNQTEIAAMRAELNSVSAKQDQIHTVMGDMQHTVSDISLQMTAMADTLKSMRSSPSGKPAESSHREQSAEELAQQSSEILSDQALLLQKRAAVETLRRQYTMEQEISRTFQQNVPAARRSAPPGYGKHPFSSAPVRFTDPIPEPQQPPDHQHRPPQNDAWHNYQKTYEQEMRTQFLKNITKGPRLDFPKFEGGNPVEWIRQCEKCFQMSATPDEYKFSLAQLYIVGKADVWLRRSKILQQNPTWPKFCEMLIQRFSSHSSYQLVETFNHLKQNNATVIEYAEQFEELMATIAEENPELSEGWFVRCFVNGLRDGIKYQLRPLRPPTLTEAFWLAKDMEHSHPPRRAYIPNTNPPFQHFPQLPAAAPAKALPAPAVLPKLEYPQPLQQ